ncbi:coiled-coil domain-containing protein [Dactylosporangium darangshiense]|uniref:ARB-07466-like C-terminal domain-containing protein n=1 Tax=Dactylosporangium darangshiense TaxID=579108 RepID=A0ABP8CX69_9ACTN
MSSRHPHRRVLITLLAALVLGGLAATPASAEPSGDPGDEGAAANPTLGSVLEDTTRAWTDAKARFDASVKHQAELTTQLQSTEAQLASLQDQVSSIAVAAYRTGPLTTFAALMDADSPDSFAERAGSINELAHHNDNLLHQFRVLREAQASQKKALDEEVATQQQQVATMEQQKKEAEKALALAGGPSKGFVSANLPVADPVKRNSDGSLPKESCNQDDPTTTGCLTPRTLHDMQTAQKDGFKRFVSCYRPSGPYEHPKGRACDFSVQKTSGFGGVATGDDFVYGSTLAAYFVKNAYNLGVMYVIWFKQIWTPAAGWHHYSGVAGDPSSDHTNHVHLSVL